MVGTVWNEKNKPPEGKEKVYRKDYANSRGKAYRKFDANAKELTDYVDGKKILKAKSLEIQVGGATVTISEGGEIKVTSPAGITLAASGELKMTASTINATAGTVNIQGGGGDVVVSGKSLVSHTHTGNLGKKTSAPLYGGFGMYVGIFGDVIFSVGHLRVLTPSNFKGTTGANWAEHEVLGGKARAEYLSPKLREYTFDILLDAALGVNPRKMLNRLTEMSENGEIHYLIIGFAPVSQNKFRVTEISDSWDSVIKHGLLMQCKVSLTIKEYI